MKKLKLKEQFTTVTTVSKIIAAIIFIALPFIGFLLGIQFEKNNSGFFDFLCGM